MPEPRLHLASDISVIQTTFMFLPFVCIATDVSFWYFTKIYQGFAWVVLMSGVLMALGFAIMWITSMYQMWFYRVSEHVKGRQENLVD